MRALRLKQYFYLTGEGEYLFFKEMLLKKALTVLLNSGTKQLDGEITCVTSVFSFFLLYD